MVQVEGVEEEDGVLALKVIRGNLLDLAVDDGISLPRRGLLLDYANML